MNLAGKRVLVTGAAGGIGKALVSVLIARGAYVLLTGRDGAALRNVVARLGVSTGRAECVEADLARASERTRLCEFAARWEYGIDVLINNAGTSGFGLLDEHSADDVENILTTNLLAPIDLCRQLLPHLLNRPEGRVVNIGSVLGHIGLAANSVYCGSKFGLRGFSEALRREVADTQLRVHYFAPRATHTTLNSPAVDEMNMALATKIDEPAKVASDIIRLLEQERLESVFGWPEKLFARINAVMPRLVDRSLRKQLPIVRKYAQATAPSRASGITPIASLSRKIG